jgi:hypothetical protein
VSALLDHWLDWDRPPVTSDTAVSDNGDGDNDKVPKSHQELDPTAHIDELISHLATLADPIPRVRQYCTNLGCDVINRPDEEGRTLLHHLLSGKQPILDATECFTDLDKLNLTMVDQF